MRSKADETLVIVEIFVDECVETEAQNNCSPGS